MAKPVLCYEYFCVCAGPALVLFLPALNFVWFSSHLATHTHTAPRYDEWQATYAEWQKENPDKAKMLQDGIDHKIPSVDELMAAIPEFDQDTDIATRIAGQMVLQVCAVALCLAAFCWTQRVLGLVLMD